MQRTADFHDQIADADLPEAIGVMDDAAALDATVDVLDPDPATGDAPIGPFLGAREGPTPWLLGGHDDLDVVECEGQEAEILEQPAPRGQGVRGGIGHALIVGAASVSVTEQEDRERRVDQPHVFQRVTLLLPTVIFLLLFGIGRAVDRTFSAIMPKRGVVELPSAECVSNIVANSSAVRAGSSSWSAKA